MPPAPDITHHRLTPSLTPLGKPEPPGTPPYYRTASATTNSSSSNSGSSSEYYRPVSLSLKLQLWLSLSAVSGLIYMSKWTGGTNCRQGCLWVSPRFIEKSHVFLTRCYVGFLNPPGIIIQPQPFMVELLESNIVRITFCLCTSALCCNNGA